MTSERYIVHVDMDAFFAAVEQRDTPAYRGRPVVVGADPKHGKGRGVVSTCSYEARVFGIRSAMPISEAYRRCPHAIFLPVDMARYETASARIYAIFDRYTPDIEPIGIDEAFLDITHTHHLFGAPLHTCMLIKDAIRQETGLTASAGLAPTMMAAKIASDLRKPDGMVEVTRATLSDFLRPLDIRRIWGLGPKAEAILSAQGIRTIGELADRSPKELESMFGATGRHFYELANGIDTRPVTPPGDALSVSNESTFDADTDDQDLIACELARLCESVSARLRHARLRCQTVTLKIRLAPFKTFTRSITARPAANYFEFLYKAITGLYNGFDRHQKKVRLVGVKASALVPEEDGKDLFTGSGSSRTEDAHRAIDRIRAKFGEQAICRAGSIPRSRTNQRKAA